MFFCLVSVSVPSQQLPTIAIVDLEPKGGFHREEILKQQAESIAAILESAMVDINTVKKDPLSETDAARIETEGEVITIPGSTEIVIQGDSVVRIAGNTEIRFDNRLREKVEKLLDVTDTSMDVNETAEISNLLRSGVIKTNAFEVVERQKIQNIVDEQKLNLSGLTADSDKLKELGNLWQADRILLGTVGRLYGKIIITTRLVDVTSGKIVFANNTYSNEEDLVYYIEELARDIAAKGIAERQNVRISEIRTYIDRKEYATAKEYLDVLLQNNPEKAGKETQELHDIIIENLSEENFKEAKRAFRRKKYQFARDLVNEAIAIRNEKKYFELRNRIEVEEQEYIAKQREKEDRERRLRKERDAIGIGERIGNYYKGITVNGFLIGGTYNIPTSLDFDFQYGKLTDFGGEFLLKGEFFDPPNEGNTSFNWMGYTGLNAQYMAFEGRNTVLIRPYISPFLSWGLKLGNIIVDIGFDGGGAFWIGNNFPAGYIMGITGGGTGIFEIKAYKRIGVFAGAKLEYAYFPGNIGYSNLLFRFIGGLSF